MISRGRSVGSALKAASNWSCRISSSRCGYALREKQSTGPFGGPPAATGPATPDKAGVRQYRPVIDAGDLCRRAIERYPPADPQCGSASDRPLGHRIRLTAEYNRAPVFPMPLIGLGMQVQIILSDIFWHRLCAAPAVAQPSGDHDRSQCLPSNTDQGLWTQRTTCENRPKTSSTSSVCCGKEETPKTTTRCGRPAGR